MLQVPEETGRRFDAAMVAADLAVQFRWHYRNWLRYYLDFCAGYGRPLSEEASLDPFLEKLASKNQSVAQPQQAAQAVRLYTGMLHTTRQFESGADGRGKQSPPPQAGPTRLPRRPQPDATTKAAEPRPGSPEVGIGGNLCVLEKGHHPVHCSEPMTASVPPPPTTIRRD